MCQIVTVMINVITKSAIFFLQMLRCHQKIQFHHEKKKENVMTVWKPHATTVPAYPASSSQTMITRKLKGNKNRMIIVELFGVSTASSG